MVEDCSNGCRHWPKGARLGPDQRRKGRDADLANLEARLPQGLLGFWLALVV